MRNKINQYLLEEYKDNSLKPQKVKVNAEEVIVPAAYLLDSKKGMDAFVADYFNHFDEVILPEIAKYEDNGLEPKFVKIGKLEFPIPYIKRAENPRNIVVDILQKSKDNYEKAILLGIKANEYRKEPKLLEVGVKKISKLKSYISQKENMEKAQEEKRKLDFSNKVRSVRNKIVLSGLLIGGVLGGKSLMETKDKDDVAKDKIENVNTPEKSKEELSEERFQRILGHLFVKEGGYATDKQIDQETNFGIINSTYSAFKKQFPDVAKSFPAKLKDLKRQQAETIIRKGFYEHYKIADIENESIAEMLLDICYNHKSDTRRGFVKDGLCAVLSNRGEDLETRPRNWQDIIKFVNECDNNEQKCFYDNVAEKRLEFMNDGRVKEFVGLISRAKGYVGNFKPVEKEVNKPEKTFFWASLKNKSK